jgi:shikimate kinase
MRYFLIGFMGSGKTYWASQWSETFQLPLIELDAEIEQRAGCSIAEIFAQKGEAHFRKLEAALLREYLKKDNYILSCGGGTPCFHHNMKRMNQKGITIYLKSTPEQLALRLQGEQVKRPLIKEVSKEQLPNVIAAQLKRRASCYSKAIYHFDTRYITNENFERILRRHSL